MKIHHILTSSSQNHHQQHKYADVSKTMNVYYNVKLPIQHLEILLGVLYCYSLDGSSMKYTEVFEQN